MTTTAKRPNLDVVSRVISAILADPDASVMTSAEGEPLRDNPTRTKSALLADAYACDECHLEIYVHGKREGWIYLVPGWGNTGAETVADHTDNLYTCNVISEADLPEY